MRTFFRARACRGDDTRRRLRVQRDDSLPLWSDDDVAHHSESESVNDELDDAADVVSSLTRPADVRLDPRRANAMGGATGGACRRKYCKRDVCIRP